MISTTTNTGLGVARRTFPDLVTFYAPLDFSWATRQALARVRPTVLALVELELWPNLVWAAKQAGTPGCDRERPAEPSPALAAIVAFAGRSDRRSAASTRLRFRITSTPSGSRIWASPPAGFWVTGSIKYDGLETDRNNPKTLALRRAQAFGVGPGFRGGEHDGGGGSRRTRGLQGGPTAAPSAPPGGRASACGAI